MSEQENGNGTGTAVAKMEPRPQVEAGPTPMAIIPRDLDQLQRVAKIMLASGLMPSAMKTEAAVAVAIMAGLEIGMSPFQSVQNLAVINGRPTIWGDAMPAVVMASGLLKDYQEERIEDKDGNVIGYTVRAWRKGIATPFERTFTMMDATRAKLKGKTGPWTEYPQRMLLMRARGWALRDGFADVLKGMRAAEEVRDEGVIDVEATEPATKRVLATAADLTEDATGSGEEQERSAEDEALDRDLAGSESERPAQSPLFGPAGDPRKARR